MSRCERINILHLLLYPEHLHPCVGPDVHAWQKQREELTTGILEHVRREH